jgi:hypothetical protein
LAAAQVLLAQAVVQLPDLSPVQAETVATPRRQPAARVAALLAAAAGAEREMLVRLRLRA